MQTLIGQFERISQAQAAIDALLERNYDRSDISFVANDVKSDAAIGDQSDAAAAGQAALGLLVGFGSLAIPYVGPVLAAGPLAVGLAGAASGVAQKDAHWLGGALAEHGVPDHAARSYGDAIARGGALVMMGAREEVSPNIVAILEEHGAVVHRHARDPNSSGA
jgi:hypothetical protein